MELSLLAPETSNASRSRACGGSPNWRNSVLSCCQSRTEICASSVRCSSLISCMVDAHVLDHVLDELRAVLDCGVEAKGYAHVRCGGCGLDRVAALSPRCSGRHMTESARHLTDRVFRLASGAGRSPSTTTWCSHLHGAPRRRSTAATGDPLVRRPGARDAAPCSSAARRNGEVRPRARPLALTRRTRANSLTGAGRPAPGPGRAGPSTPARDLGYPARGAPRGVARRGVGPSKSLDVQLAGGRGLEGPRRRTLRAANGGMPPSTERLRIPPVRAGRMGGGCAEEAASGMLAPVGPSP